MRTGFLARFVMLFWSFSALAFEVTAGHKGAVSLDAQKAPHPENFLGEGYTITQREFALKVCLNSNYERLGVYKTKALKDYTRVQQTLDPQKSMRLIEFIERNTGEFYTENLPIDSELDPPPYNAIFGRCINFYKSNELNDFLLELGREKGS